MVGIPRNKKYALYPGYVISKNDGDLHYVRYHDLIRLYRLDPRECIDASKFEGRIPGHLITLGVRHDGNYDGVNINKENKMGIKVTSCNVEVSNPAVSSEWMKITATFQVEEPETMTDEMAVDLVKEALMNSVSEIFDGILGREKEEKKVSEAMDLINHWDTFRRKVLKEQTEREELLHKIKEAIVAKLGGSVYVDTIEVGYKFIWRGEHEALGPVYLEFIVSNEELLESINPIEVISETFLQRYKDLFTTCKFCGARIFKRNGLWVEHGDIAFPQYCKHSNRNHEPEG